MTMRTDELDFQLPGGLIAQEPPSSRSTSRLLHYQRETRRAEHRTFSELPQLLRPGDLLVFNNAKVLPARFTLRKETGGLIEGLFIAEDGDGCWRVLLKNMGDRIGAMLYFSNAPQITVTILEKCSDGEYRVLVDPATPAAGMLERVGRMPLPPYIRRDKRHDPRDDSDRVRYQTIFAKVPGAVAAPTAALHFTPELFESLDARGIRRTFVTLQVGIGTFKQVASDTLEGHAMHVETYSIDAAAADDLNRAKSEGRRIIAVGTTAARVLESQPSDRPFEEKTSQTGIFIYPPYHWKHVNAMVTNFHLPRSTLVALVAAMTGLDEQRRLYHMAIENCYRFFSYGDAMFID